MTTDNIYVQLLKGAQKRIKNKTEYYVCCAISEESQARNLEYFDAAAKRLQDWIAEALDYAPVLETWLKYHGIYDISYEQARDHRIAWIGHMIEEWKHATEPN